MSYINIAIYVYSVAFFVLRGGELAYLLVDPSFWSTVAVIAAVVWYLQLSFSLFIKVLLLSGVYVFDAYYFDFPKDFPVNSAAGKTYLVTGANSGVGKRVDLMIIYPKNCIGYYAALQLVELGATVYLACRSTLKCERARDLINSHLAYSGKAFIADDVVGLDLSSLEIIRLYADKLKDVPLDGILNNAGFGLMPEAPPTIDGLEVSFGSMHVGHHLLTKLILEQRTSQDKPVRVVNVASGTHYVCMSVDCYNGKEEHFESLIRGSPDPLAYYRAKLSNVLHAYELPKRFKGVTAYSVNLGFVGTNINGLTALAELRLQRQGPAGKPGFYL